MTAQPSPNKPTVLGPQLAHSSRSKAAGYLAATQTKTPDRTKAVKYWCSLQKLVAGKWIAHTGIGDVYVCTNRSLRFLENRLWNATAPAVSETKFAEYSLVETSFLSSPTERVVAVPAEYEVSFLHRIRFFEGKLVVGTLHVQVLAGMEILLNRWKDRNRKAVVD